VNAIAFDADVSFGLPVDARPLPYATEHAPMKSAQGGFIEEVALAREDPAISFCNILLFEFVELAAKGDVRGNEAFAFLRGEGSGGIRDHPIARRSPWQNGHVERLIGSIRRECLDHIVIMGEDHLRRVLEAYASYYNRVRPHLALDKDAPEPRSVQRIGQVVTRPILGGLHHEYCRA
jgi:hypothetical protein